MQQIQDIQRRYGAAFDLVVKAAEKKLSTADVLEALKEFAAGKDGVLGTADDTVDPETLEVLSDLIESGLAQKIVTLARVEASKVKFCCF